MHSEKNGKLLLVVDCRHLNNYKDCPKFTQEGIETVAHQIKEDDKLISVDLKNGFHHVKLPIAHRKYIAIF